MTLDARQQAERKVIEAARAKAKQPALPGDWWIQELRSALAELDKLDEERRVEELAQKLYDDTQGACLYEDQLRETQERYKGIVRWILEHFSPKPEKQ